MLDTSIITGKAFTGNPNAGNSVKKRLYLKIFPGQFWYRAPRAKKAKVYGGELFVRYSNREWPEKKNGPLVGDPGLLVGISNLLRELNLEHVEELQYAKIQHGIKEVLTLTVGANLAKEILDRGWAKLTDIQEPSMPKISASLSQSVILAADVSEEVTIEEAIIVPLDENETHLDQVALTETSSTVILTQDEAIAKLYKKKSSSKKKTPVNK